MKTFTFSLRNLTFLYEGLSSVCNVMFNTSLLQCLWVAGGSEWGLVFSVICP